MRIRKENLHFEIPYQTADEFMRVYKAELRHYPYSSNGYAPLGYDATWVLALALNKTVTQLRENNKSVDSFSYKDAEFAQDMSKTLLHITTKGITVRFDGFMKVIAVFLLL